MNNQWKFLPLISNDKKPFEKQWTNDTYGYPYDVAKTTFQFGNIGLLTGKRSGVLVVDIDTKNGKDGNGEWAALTAGIAVPQTVEVKTPSGGRHLYFAMPPGFKSFKTSAIDFQGDGRQVVFPGSVLTSGEYVWINSPDDCGVEDLPPALLERIQAMPQYPTARKVVPTRIVAAGAHCDSLATERAAAYLAKCPPAVQGEHGDAHTFAVAGHLLAFGLSVDAVADLMGGAWNAACSPPWDAAELRSKIESAATNGTPRAAKSLTRQPNADEIAMGITAEDIAKWDMENFETQAAQTVEEIIGIEKESAPDVSQYAELNKPTNIQRLYDSAPPLIKEITEILHSLDPLSNPILHFYAAYAYVGAIIGKNLEITNMGRTYYPNLWYCGLADSSANKTFILLLPRILDKARNANFNGNHYKTSCLTLDGSSTMAALFNTIGVKIAPKEWAAMTELEREQKRFELEEKCTNSKARLIVSDEFTGTLSRILDGGKDVGKSSSLPHVLKLADGKDSIVDCVGYDGFRAIYDSCVSVIGYTQPSMWQNAFNGQAFIDSGLIGRFTIIDERQFHRITVAVINKSTDDLMAELLRLTLALMDTVSTKGKVKLNYGKQDNGKDFSGICYKKFRNGSPLITFAMENVIDESKFKGKMIVQAAKLSAIDTYLMGNDKASFMRQLFIPFWAVKSFAMNKEIDEIAMKIRKCLMSHGGKASIRELQRSKIVFNGYPMKSFEIKEHCELMEERKEIIIAGNICYLKNKEKTK